MHSQNAINYFDSVFCDEFIMMNFFFFFWMVDGRKALSFISSRDHSGKVSPSQASDTLRARFEPARNLSLAFVEWRYVVLKTITPQHHHVTW